MCSFFSRFAFSRFIYRWKGKSDVTDIKTDNNNKNANIEREKKIKIIYTTLKVSIKNTFFSSLLLFELKTAIQSTETVLMGEPAKKKRAIELNFQDANGEVRHHFERGKRK